MTTQINIPLILDLYEKYNFNTELFENAIISFAPLEYRKKWAYVLFENKKTYCINGELYISRGALFNILIKLKLCKYGKGIISRQIKINQNNKNSIFSYFSRNEKIGRSGNREYRFPVNKISQLINEVL